MKDLTFIEFYILVVILLWSFLLIATLYIVNTQRLKKRGYKEEYINFIKKDTKKRNIGIAVVMPILGGLSAFIIWIFTREINSFQNLIYIALLWIILIIPFPILDLRQTQKNYKNLAIETNSEVLFDFNHRILHLIFRPYIEILAAILVISYFILFIMPFHIVFIHIFLLWALYSVGRYSKYLTAPQLKDGYIYLYVFIMINQALIIFHIFNEVISRSGCEECLSALGYSLGIIIGGLLLIKFIYYIFSFPKFNLRLNLQ